MSSLSKNATYFVLQFLIPTFLDSPAPKFFLFIINVIENFFFKFFSKMNFFMEFKSDLFTSS